MKIFRLNYNIVELGQINISDKSWVFFNYYFLNKKARSMTPNVFFIFKIVRHHEFVWYVPLIESDTIPECRT